MKYRRLGRTALRVSELCLGTMNFGPLTTRSRLVRDHGPRARARHQLLRHRQPLRRRQGPGHDRDDRRPLVRAGRRPAREGRARDQGVRPDDASGRTTAASRPGTSATRATRACAGCRPTTSTCTRCTTSTGARRGTRSGRRWRRSSTQGKVIYVGSSNFAGWHIAQANEAARAPQLPRPRERAEPLQPRVAHGRARGAARVPRLRPRRHPVEPARAAGCSAASAARATPRAARTRNPRYEAMRPQLEQWEKFCAELGEEPAAVALAWLLHQTRS